MNSETRCPRHNSSSCKSLAPEPQSLSSVDRAVGRYSRSLRQGNIPCRADGDAKYQTENYRLARQRIELRAEQIKEILCDMGVPLLQYVSYRNFGLHVDKLIRSHSGTTLLSLAQSAIDYWTAYGLDSAVLLKICEDVFGLEL